MPIRWLLEAENVEHWLPSDDNFSTQQSYVNSDETDDSISYAMNNVRFEVDGFASAGGFETALYHLETRATFRYEIDSSGTLRTSTIYKPIGFYTLAAKPKPWWELLPGGFSQVRMWIRQDTRVDRPSMSQPLMPTRYTSWRRILNQRVYSGAVTMTKTGAMASQLFDHVRQQNLGVTVVPGDKVRIRARCRFEAFATNRGEFDVNFDASGHGLNVPLAVIRT